MKKLPETTRDWIDYYQDLATKANNSYQITGEQRYYTKFYKADEAADAFRAKQRELEDEDYKRTMRIRNAAAIADRLEDRDYKLDEVRRIVMKIAGL